MGTTGDGNGMAEEMKHRTKANQLKLEKEARSWREAR